MTEKNESAVTIRVATPADIPECGRICYAAFSAINAAHGFPCDFPSVEVATGIIGFLFSAPQFYCVVAEIDGRVVGSNCLDERAIIHGIGPITVDPAIQNRGVGRSLMQAVLDHSAERAAPGIRLVQAAFHNRSLSLYTALGFDVREPLSCLQGRTTVRSIPGCEVRPATPADLAACNALCHRVHGFDRGVELAQGMEDGSALVVERGGRITGCASNMALFGFGVTETDTDLQALLASVESFGSSGILLPSRNHAVLRWALAHGLRVVQPMTLMSKGLYNEPSGAWFASVTF